MRRNLLIAMLVVACTLFVGFSKSGDASVIQLKWDQPQCGTWNPSVLTVNLVLHPVITELGVDVYSVTGYANRAGQEDNWPVKGSVVWSQVFDVFRGWVIQFQTGNKAYHWSLKANVRDYDLTGDGSAVIHKAAWPTGEGETYYCLGTMTVQ